MKTKSSILSLIILLAASLPATAQNPGDRVFKEVTENGKKVIKELLYDSVTEYNEDGKEIHNKDTGSESVEYWYEYDQKGNLIHKKDSRDRETLYEYDSMGKIKHKKYSDFDFVIEFWYECTFHPNGRIKSQKIYTPLRDSGEESEPLETEEENSEDEVCKEEKIDHMLCKKVTVKGKKVKRWVMLSQIKDFDEEGNEFHGKDDRHEYWQEYDANKKLTYKKEFFRLDPWYEYDPTRPPDYEEWYEYDSKGNLLHKKNTKGEEKTYKYNSIGNMIHETNSDGREKRYGQKGNLIYEKDFGIETWYEYDSWGNKIRTTNSNGNEVYYEYDQNGKLIHEFYKRTSEQSTYLEIWYEYDSNGNKTHEKYSDISDTWYEYDSKGNITHMKDTYADGSEFWYEYNFYPNGKIKSKKGYIPFK